MEQAREMDGAIVPTPASDGEPIQVDYRLGVERNRRVCC